MADTDVLVVGAGPTGLALAAQLRTYGASVRIVDRRPSPERPSRALVVQPRTLEVLRPIGVTPELLARGDSDARARFHLGVCEVVVAMRDAALGDTGFPFLLVLRQADMEAVLRDHLGRDGTTVEWGTEFVACHQGRSGVAAVLRSAHGEEEQADARYVAGCDGSASTVRRVAGIEFVGAAYRQSVALADVSVDGDLPPEPLQAFVSVHGGLVLFAGGEHAPWRLIVVRGHRARAAGPLDAARLASSVHELTAGRVRVRDVAWLSDIPQQHRLAEAFRSGRILLAGDAAHVHSPAGARGMNTGIQDACNLGWKLALVARGAGDKLLDSYDAERRPVARTSLLLTHLIFLGEAADHPVLRWTRAAVAPFVVPVAVRMGPAVRLALRTIGQLRVSYPMGDVAVEGHPTPSGGPRAGARMSDMPLQRGGAPCRLHDVLATPGFHLLLCGTPDGWDEVAVARLRRRFDGPLRVHRISAAPSVGGLCDPGGAALRRLGAHPTAQYLVRPDGHIGYRCAGANLDLVQRQLASWLPGVATSPGHR
ncbi:MAG TPA: FAD-dependent monooxygenase [Euzebyales bacterium]|nr:FAD-dependent monooxygenase [Euzebyales bacterium]